VLYSPREVDLGAVEHSIETGTGRLAERLHAALGDALVPFPRVSYQQDAMGFTAKGRSNGVVALLVSIDHTP